MRTRLTTAALACLLAGTAVPAFAQARRAPARTAAPAPAVSVAASGHLGVTRFAASQTFEAVLGSASGLSFGGGVDVRWRGGLFAGVRLSRFEQTGTRVAVHRGEVFDLGIPATIAMTPIETVAGYRFGGPRARVLPYAGGGLGWVRYQETSSFATDAENVAETFKSYHLLGGAELRVSRLVGLAAEAQWTSVPDAIGGAPTSAAAAFDERDLGGTTLRIRVIVGR